MVKQMFKPDLTQAQQKYQSSFHHAPSDNLDT